MYEVIVGADGFVGSALAARRPDAVRTSRRPGYLDGQWPFDLAAPGPLPEADIVYLCAGVNGALTCARDPQESWRVNVDGTIHVAAHYRDKAFVVWISSTTVEWSTEHYGCQKRAAETVLRTMSHVGIVRAGRVTKENIGDLCDTMLRIGRDRVCGVTLWNAAEQPYAK